MKYRILVRSWLVVVAIGQTFTDVGRADEPKAGETDAIEVPNPVQLPPVQLPPGPGQFLPGANQPVLIDDLSPDTMKAKGIGQLTPDPQAKNPAHPQAALRRLTPTNPVWVDSQNKQVVMDGAVCLTKGFLEMFACLKNSKEHESIVAVDTPAYIVHAALLALGAKPGSPVKYTPEYVPASGDEVDVSVYWTGADGKQHQARAQDWIRNAKTKQPLTFPWVFAGSGFYTDEETKKEYYLAEAGDFICVSNFPSAMMDLPIESSQDNEHLMFEAATEAIPPRGTKVQIVLTPHVAKDK